MKKPSKPADAKTRALLKKLEALSERGVEGERAVARKKLARLKARFDFSAPLPGETPDLFAGHFRRSHTAARIFSFTGYEWDVANSVKWAIETATQIPCLFRNGDLFAEATPATSRRLAEIASHIGQQFRALVTQFGTVDGVTSRDRGLFVMGLYDGMMNETREVGQRLPSRAVTGSKRKARKVAVLSQQPKPIIDIHPYSIGLNLGKQIRFSAPLENLTAELESATRRQLS